MKTIGPVAICKKNREIAASALTTTLRQFLPNRNVVPEKLLAENWLTELRKFKEIFPEGWYTPPPHGIGVLFGEARKDGRQNYKTLRPEDMWPQDAVFLKEMNDIAYLFASPVDRQTGIIGDFGLTVYLGKRREVKDHLLTCMQINREIFDHIEVGMTFAELYRFAEKTLARNGMTNEITSTTDPAGRDYGHTIPASYLDGTEEERSLLQNAGSNWDDFKNAVSKKRIFVNGVEETTYQPGMAITLEPRLTVNDKPDLPMGTFHTIVVIHEDGKKELLTQFEKIFSLTHMDYML